MKVGYNQDGIEEFKNKVLSEIPIIKEQDTSGDC